jgi:hypothetical protein
MKKSTGTVSLVLLGTALALAGCSHSDDEDEEQQAAGGHGVHSGTHFIPGIRTGGFRGSGRSTVATPSVRGGFGGTHAGGVAS